MQEKKKLADAPTAPSTFRKERGLNGLTVLRRTPGQPTKTCRRFKCENKTLRPVLFLRVHTYNKGTIGVSRNPHSRAKLVAFDSVAVQRNKRSS
jgi:hypothetical protein